ncbi:ferritin-like domain-containing protein [Oscillibacter sp.]|uniref:ferritin-like domain-containing protein n=1 Tax=Oscillibacter sp. TaxID=1945593 RepID=UPI0028AB3A46|nr:ferritin-like domain-containing protein [Oscillibacter sp.]
MQQQADTYDYRQYDKIWQRVSPTLDPYPGVAPECATAKTPAVSAAVSEQEETVCAAQTKAASMTESLSCIEANPCCMGESAMDMLRVLQNFIEEELAAKRYYLAFSRQAPVWARQMLRDIAENAAAHARRLMAVHYLITCQCYQPASSYERIYVGQLCPALRARYQDEVCRAQQYERAAENTSDPCLSKLLFELSADGYRNADQLMMLLERAMRQQQ